MFLTPGENDHKDRYSWSNRKTKSETQKQKQKDEVKSHTENKLSNKAIFKKILLFDYKIIHIHYKSRHTNIYMETIKLFQPLQVFEYLSF